MSRFLRSICHPLSKAEGVDGEGVGLIHHFQRHFYPLPRRAWEGIRSQKYGQTMMLEKLLVPSSLPQSVHKTVLLPVLEG